MTKYHLYKKSVTGKNGKTIKKWYYWYYDPAGKQVRKVCPNCSTKAEAEAFISTLSAVPVFISVPTVSQLAENMFIPNSPHHNRLLQFGRILSERSILDARTYLKAICSEFGECKITELTIQRIQKYLLQTEKSGSWKNSYQTYVKEIFKEAQWQGCPVVVPVFSSFKRNSVKQSVLSTAEIEKLFQTENFSSEMFFFFFLVCLSAGLRLGEVRALRASQLIRDKKALIIDGFLSQNGERNPFNKTGSIDNPRYRVVLIPDTVVLLLDRWIVSNNISFSDYVFTYNGKPVRKELAEKEFKRALLKAGIVTDGRKLTPHALRYTYVTRTRRLLGTENTMLMAGHMGEQMTDHYTRFQLEETIKQLEPVQASVNRFFE